MRARTAVVLLAFVVLAAACSSDTETAGPLAPPSTTAPGEVPDTAGAPGDAPATDGGGDAPVPGTDPGSAPPSEGAAPTTTSAAGSTAAAPAPGGVGAYAGFYLRPAESASILVEVLAQPDAAPRAETVERARDVLAELSGKDVRATIGTFDAGAREWTADDIRAQADASGTAQTRDRAVLRLLYLEGGLAGNERAMGVAVRSDVAAVFADRVDEAAGVLGNRGAIEDAVTIHEIGHLLGLVDLVLDTGREDPEHPGHSPNRGSVMYYAVESTLIGSVLTGGPPRDFDQADLDDLARIRNG